MKLVLEMTSHSGDGSIVYRTVEEFPATLGRGYHNDIILSDPHVSASHLRIEYDGESWSVADLGSENGLFVNEKQRKGETCRLSSGDVLRVGRTELRVFSPSHPVSDTLLLQKASPLFRFLSKPANAWLSFMAAVAVMTGWTYLEVWSDQVGMTLSVAAGATFFFIMVWAGLWSVVGRLVRHRPHFQSHIALISLYTIGSALFWYVQAYLNFLSSENTLAMATSYTLNIALFTVLLYGALSLATDLPKKRRTLSALYFSMGAGISVFALGYVSAMNFIPDPVYPYSMEPYLSWLAPGQTAAEFMDGSTKLFDADAFTAKAEAQ